jgi:uncharacterized protein
MARWLAIGLVLAATLAQGDELRRSGFIGVQAGPVDEAARARLNLADTRGVVVLALVEGGTARDAGLERDDVVTAIAGHDVEGVADFVAAVAKLRAGDRVPIRYLRNGAPRTTEALIKPRPFESAPDVETQYRSVLVRGTERRAIVTRPRDSARHPAVLYLTGIGCFSQESLGLRTTEAKLLYGLSRAGFVTMRVEKSGIGDSEGVPCASPEADLDAEMAGYAAGLQALAKYGFVDPSKVFVMGLSIGGVEAPIVAQRGAVRGIVVINTASKPFLEYLMETRRRQGLLAGTPYDVLERHLRLNERCNHDLLVARRSPESIVGEDAACADYITYPAPYTYMRQWADLDPAEQWKRVDVPVLIVYGEADYVATIADSPYLRDMIESFHPGRATLRGIPNMEHAMTQAASMQESIARPQDPAGPFQAMVLDVVRDWLLRHANG